MTSNLLKSRLLQRFLISCRSSVPHRELGLSASRFEKEIVIPNRIPRSPTDILEALASTVGRDSSGPHYKFHDDPFLIPTSNFDKKSYALSKESGRRAARWVMNKHGNLFQHQPEDPVIEAFYPKITYDEKSDVSETTIQELIEKNLVSDAIQVYEICRMKGIELSEDVRQDLLEFVCYYNCEDTMENDWLEERSFLQSGRGHQRKTWKDNGLAETLFQSLENKGSRAYGALIRGMSKHFQIDRCWKLYEEALDKDIPLDTETHNAIIGISMFLKDTGELRWDQLKSLLKTMSDKGVHPNLGTLNRSLSVLVRSAGWRKMRDYSLQVLSEFHSIGITPSLATYHYLLQIHCREQGPPSSILISILNHIEGKEFQIQDVKDTDFFATAMGVCCNHLKDFTVAKRVDDLMRTGKNYLLLGDSNKESIYHRLFFSLATSVLTADQVMEIYDDMVPNIYIPEPSVMLRILHSLEVYHAAKYIPRIWSDIIYFEMSNQEVVVTEVLTCIASYIPAEESVELTKQIGEIAWDIWIRGEEPLEKKDRKVTWSGPKISNVLSTLVACNSYERAVTVFRQITNDPERVFGWVSIQTLNLLNKAAININDTDFAVLVATYAVDAGHQEAAVLAKEIISKLDLQPQQKAKLTTALGVDVLSMDEEL